MSCLVFILNYGFCDTFDIENRHFRCGICGMSFLGHILRPLKCMKDNDWTHGVPSQYDSIPISRLL